jgi:hypothetical protein
MALKPKLNSIDYLYIQGKPQDDISIAFNRYKHLEDLAYIDKNLLVAIKYKDFDGFTKWEKFRYLKTISYDDLLMAYEVHRSILANEIIIESDYPTYSENREASQYVGKIIESLGYIPHYYYSGGKSIHIHILINFDSIKNISERLKELILNQFQDNTFFIEFIRYLRIKLIRITNKYVFDEHFINPKHLIRSELSSHKNGWKTYLGNTWSEIPETPPICTIENREYPVIASLNNKVTNEVIKDMKVTNLNNPEQILEDFLRFYISDKAKRQNDRIFYQNERREEKGKLNKNINTLLSLDFKNKDNDGKKRFMFILCNELKQKFPIETATQMMLEWNSKLITPFTKQEIMYRLRRPETYIISNKYIKNLMDELKIK